MTKYQLRKAKVKYPEGIVNESIFEFDPEYGFALDLNRKISVFP